MDKIQISWPFIGNKHVTNFLANSIINKRLAQVYIFSGISNVGKARTGIHLAKILLCQSFDAQKSCNNCNSCLKFEKNIKNHSDLFILKKEVDKKNISTEQVREFIRNLRMSSFADGYKIGIIKSAHHLNINGFNALLKTLEEPQKKVIIILTTSDIDIIPKTIQSRAQNLIFKSIHQNLIHDLLINKHNCEKAEAKNISKMCLGRPAIAIKLLENKEYYSKYLDNINAFLDFNTKNLEHKFSFIDKIISKKQTAQESANIIFKLIEAWQTLVRDCLLINYSQRNFVQHSLIINELELVQKKRSVNELLNLNNTLKKAKKYLVSNVSPRNILEYIAVNTL